MEESVIFIKNLANQIFFSDEAGTFETHFSR